MSESQSRYMSTESAKYAAQELTKLFPKTNEEPMYSVGYKKWSELSKRQQQELMISNSLSYSACLDQLAAMEDDCVHMALLDSARIVLSYKRESAAGLLEYCLGKHVLANADKGDLAKANTMRVGVGLLAIS